MSNKMSIGFRLRKDLDTDIQEAISKMPPQVVSELCRNGLRLMLGIRTTKRMTVAEQPLNVPSNQQQRPVPEETKEVRVSQQQSRPSVFVNQKRV